MKTYKFKTMDKVIIHTSFGSPFDGKIATVLRFAKYNDNGEECFDVKFDKSVKVHTFYVGYLRKVTKLDNALK